MTATDAKNAILEVLALLMEKPVEEQLDLRKRLREAARFVTREKESI